MKYSDLAKILKVLSNSKRLKIVDLISTNELCAHEINNHFKVKQPTLSYDMRLLKEIGLVLERVEGRQRYYSLDKNKVNEFQKLIALLTSDQEHCECIKEGI